MHATAGQFTEAIGVYRQIISDYEHLSHERLTYKMGLVKLGAAWNSIRPVAARRQPLHSLAGQRGLAPRKASPG